VSGVSFGHAAHQMLVRKGMARRAVECAREADFVTTSTPALLEEYAPRGRGALVPGDPAPDRRLPPAYDREPEVVTVGWTGTVPGHPYDLQEMGSGLQQALDATRGASRFLILGLKADARSACGCRRSRTRCPGSWTSTRTRPPSVTCSTWASLRCGSTG
jgi:hypothetical protein